MKSRKSRDTWSNRQVLPWSTKWSRAKVNRLFQENALVIANTLFQQHNRRLYTWTSRDGQYWNQIDYILCSLRWRSSIHSAKTRLVALWLRSFGLQQLHKSQWFAILVAISSVLLKLTVKFWGIQRTCNFCHHSLFA